MIRTGRHHALGVVQTDGRRCRVRCLAASDERVRSRGDRPSFFRRVWGRLVAALWADASGHVAECDCWLCRDRGFRGEGI